MKVVSSDCICGKIISAACSLPRSSGEVELTAVCVILEDRVMVNLHRNFWKLLNRSTLWKFGVIHMQGHIVAIQHELPR